MSDSDVVSRLVAADHARSYPTFKAYMPWYFGPDANRMDWLYKGKGKEIFSSNRYSGSLKVLQVVYNPDEMM